LSNKFFDVVAVADSNTKKVSSLLSLKSTLEIYEDAYELIDSVKLDAVVIATPVGSHYKFAKAALNRGLHTLVEKPICTSSEEVLELKKIAEKSEL
jgi:predicted dehydrogenase